MLPWSAALQLCSQARTHPQPSVRLQEGACWLQLPPKGLADVLLGFMRPVLASEVTRCSRQVGSCPHSCVFSCRQCTFGAFPSQLALASHQQAVPCASILLQMLHVAMQDCAGRR